MDASDRTKVLALLRHVREQARAGLEVVPAQLAVDFRLDPFVVERLVEAELGRTRAEPAARAPVAAQRTPTRELAPGSDRGAVE